MAFLYPQFLYALAAVLIPIIIHLFNLRKPKKVYFSNVDLLKEVEEQTTKKLQLKNWLILASRILFVVFLVMIFAQPYLPAEDDSQAQSGDAVYSIYLDNSLSMNLMADEQSTIFQKARKELNRLIDGLPRNAKVQLLNNDFSAKSMVMYNKDQAKEMLTEWQVSGDIRTSKDVYNRQSNTLKKYTGDNKNIIWVSDFQKSFLTANQESFTDSTKNHFIIPLKGKEVNNVYVDSVALQTPFIRPGEVQTLEVWLQNTGVGSATGVPLRLLNGDQQIASITSDLGAKSREIIKLNFTIKEPGFHRLKLEVDDNNVRFDNDFVLVLNVGETINVVEITDNEDSPLNRVYGNEPIFEYKRFKAGNVDYEALNDADLVILNELANTTSAIKNSLTSFLKGGGSVAVIPSNKNINIFNDFLIPFGPRKDTTRIKLKVPSQEHPFFNGVVARYISTADMPKTVRSAILGRSGNSILKYSTGDDYMSRFNVLGGQVYAFAAPFNEKSSNIYKHAWIVPICYRMAMLTSSSNERLAYKIGEDIVKVRYATGSNESVLNLNGANGSLIPGQRKLRNSTILQISNSELEPGYYGVLHNDSLVSDLAFNYANSESNLEYSSMAELKSMFPEATILEQEGEINFADTFTEQNFGVILWKYCVLLCLLFLAVETLLIRLL